MKLWPCDAQRRTKKAPDPQANLSAIVSLNERRNSVLRSDTRLGRILAHGPRQGNASLAIQFNLLTSLLSAAIHALQPFTTAVIVVAGKNIRNLAPIVAACQAELVHNPAPERGQFSSFQIGLRAAVDRGFSAVMLAPVDCPPLSAASLENLITLSSWPPGAAPGL